MKYLKAKKEKREREVELCGTVFSRRFFTIPNYYHRCILHQAF